MVDHSHLSAGQSSSSSSSRDLHAEFGVSQPNEASSSDANGIVAACSIPCVSMGESEPNPQAISISSEESCKGVNPNDFILNAPSISDVQDIFIAAHHFAQNDRIEVVAERKKNMDLLSFLSAHGHSIKEVNDFVRLGCSSQPSSPPHVPEERSGFPESSAGFKPLSGVVPSLFPASAALPETPTNPHLLSRGTPAAMPIPAESTLEKGEISQQALKPLGITQHCIGQRSYPSVINRAAVTPTPVSADAAATAGPCGGSLSFPSLPLLSKGADACSLPAAPACNSTPASDSAHLPQSAQTCPFPKSAVDIPNPIVGGSNPTAPSKTWSSLVASAHVQNIPLSYFPPSCEKGNVIIKPPPEILKKGNSLWATSLVGYFLHSKLPYKMVEPAAFRLWGNYGLQKVFLHANGYYILKFKSAADRDNVLALGPWYISNRQFVLKYWKEGVEFSKDVCTKTPIWVKFHQVPLSYWTHEGLSYLASGIGKPLFSDKATSLLDPMNYARICVEVDVEFHYPDSISVAVQDVDNEDISFMEVRVEYQNRPPSCPSCRTFGHSKLKCPKANYQWVPKSKIEVAVSIGESTPKPATEVKEVTQSGPDQEAQDDSHKEGWITKGSNQAKDKGKAIVSTPITKVSNSFSLIAHDSIMNDSDIDVTPSPNPLVSKLKIIDEKECRDLKNRDPNGIPSAGGKNKKKAGGRKCPKL